MGVEPGSIEDCVINEGCRSGNLPSIIAEGVGAKRACVSRSGSYQIPVEGRGKRIGASVQRGLSKKQERIPRRGGKCRDRGSSWVTSGPRSWQGCPSASPPGRLQCHVATPAPGLGSSPPPSSSSQPLAASLLLLMLPPPLLLLLMLPGGRPVVPLTGGVLCSAALIATALLAAGGPGTTARTGSTLPLPLAAAAAGATGHVCDFCGRGDRALGETLAVRRRGVARLVGSSPGSIETGVRAVSGKSARVPR